MTDDARLAAFRSMVEKDPGSIMGHYLLGTELIKTGRFSEAAEALRTCVGLKEDYSAAWRDLGKALHAAGRLDEARAAWTRGIEVATKRGDLQTIREMEVFLRRHPFFFSSGEKESVDGKKKI